MYPAVAFAELRAAKTVILTSGTLSPLDSFSSELNAPFPIVAELRHIISPEQLWLGVLCNDRQSTAFEGTYKNVDTISYQGK
jgi:Fanconi anemia group J protein